MKWVSTLEEGFQACFSSEEQQTDYYGSEGDTRGRGRRGDTHGVYRGKPQKPRDRPKSAASGPGVTAGQALATWAPSESTTTQLVGRCSRHIDPAFSHGSTSSDTHLSARISPL